MLSRSPTLAELEEETAAQVRQIIDGLPISDQIRSDTSLTTSVEEIYCRICHEDESTGEALVTPCRCKGSIAFVHLTCLERWLEVADIARCELCHYSYTLEVMRRYRFLPSVRLWFRTVADRRHLLFDLISLLILTPLVFAGLYLATAAAVYYEGNSSYQVLEASSLTIPGLVLLSGVIMCAYIVWLLAICRYHFRQWYRWWSNTLKIRVVVPPEDVMNRR